MDSVNKDIKNQEVMLEQKQKFNWFKHWLMLDVKDNGNYKKQFQAFYNKTKLFYWLAIILSTITLSLMVIFIQPHYTENVDLKRLFLVSYKTILQIIFTGMALGISAYLLQRITYNRLVDTSTVGIGNICLIGLLGLALTIDFQQPNSQLLFNNLLPFIFLLCGITASIFLYYFSKNKVGFSHTKLIVGGIFINFIAIALTVSLREKLNLTARDYIEDRILGSFGSRSDLENYLSYAILSTCFIWIIFRSPKYKILITNKTIAEQLGIKVKLLTFEIILIAGLLTSTAYILSGNILFIGIAAANIAYSLFGKKVISSMSFSGLLTTVFLLFSQFILNNLVKNLTQLDFPPPMIAPIIVAPVFVIIVIFKKNI